MARLGVELFADPTALERGLRKAGKDVTRFNTAIKETGKTGNRAFAGLGKSLAFATGGFVALSSATKFLHDSIDAAREAAVAQRSLAAQMKAAGESFKANQDQIEKVSRSYVKFGFENDEVIASLTVLERGTGKISQALKLQGLAADLARAKNIDLTAAANAVAKVFGGQETALRRAVPGLEKNAHGWDLIRLAQAKMAGQAAANTTAAERFQAVLHDTEEVVGAALLPILNKYLNQLSKWMIRMQESGQLQKDVTAAVNLLKDAISAAETVIGTIKTAFEGLNTITGSTKRSLELLLGVFAGFKALGIAAGLEATAAGVASVGTKATASAGKVAVLRGRLAALALNPYTITIALVAVGAEIVARKIADLQKMALAAESQGFQKGSRLETTLVPDLANQIRRLRAQGQTAAQILATLRKRLGGSLKADDLIAEAFAFSSGSDPKLRARINKQVAAAAATVNKAVATETKKQVTKRTAEQRNAFFDARINRQLDRVQDAPLRAQLAKLQTVAGLITKRIAATKDITRKLNLEDQLLDVQRRQKDVRAQLTQQTIERQQQLAALLQQQKEKQRQQQEALKAAAEQRRQTQMDWLQFALEKAQTTKTLADDVKALKRIIAFIKEQIRLTGRTVELARQLFETEQQLKDVRSQARKKKKRGGGDPFAVHGGFDRMLQGGGGTARPPRAVPSSGFGAGSGRPAGGGPMTIQTVNLYGVQDVAGFEHQLQKRAMARPQTRRGPV